MAANEITKSILFQYSGRTNKNRPFLVAIDGLSGAGKTTLIKRIESEIRSNDYKVMIIHIDDHIVKRNKR